MPRLTQTRRIQTDAVQGEGSYVDATSPKVGEIRRVQRAPKGEDYEITLELLVRHIIGWNWEDESGNALPLPKDDPAVIDELTNDELVYLLRELTSSRHITKN